MGILRVLVCLFLPPLAVLDKGCGSFLLVLILTCAGWVPGVLAALILCQRSSGGGSYTVVPLSRGKWSRLMAKLPSREGMEKDATDRQLGVLWDLGLQDESFLDGLGMSQADWLIGSGRRASGGMGCVAGLLLIGLIFWVGYGVKRVIFERNESSAVDPTTLPVSPAAGGANGVGGPGAVTPATTLPNGGANPLSGGEASGGASGGKLPEALARERAVLAFPQVAVLNSPLNREFVRRYNLYQKEHREYFEDPDWPTKLARESAAAIAPR